MSWLLFAAATAIIAAFGPRLARVAEALAERLGVGDVAAGAVLLGAVTSLPGITFTITAAIGGDAELAVANALGGVAAQTMFVAVADVAYRHDTLSAGVPTREVALQGAQLVILVGLVVLGMASSDVAVGPIHPVSVGLVVTYGLGILISRRLGRAMADAAGDDPDRQPDPTDRPTPEGGHGGARGKTGEVEPAPGTATEKQRSTGALWRRFAMLAVALTGAGLALARAASSIVADTPLSGAAVGFLLTSVASSSPELVTSVAAARRGAVGLAAGDIIGGNVFDVLFIAAADFASPRSVFVDLGATPLALCALILVMTGLLLAGLMRQGAGTAEVDTENLAIAAVWVAAVVVVIV